MNKKLTIVFLTVFIDLIGFGIIIPLNPYLAKFYGADPLRVGLLMSIYSLMQFVFSPLWGQFSDRHGRRPVILISLFGACFSHLGFAFATSYWGLFAFRCFAGICGGNIPAAMAYIADVTPEKDRSKGMGLIGAAFGLGFILGPAIGGVFAEVGFRLGNSPPLGGSFPAVIASLICFLNFVFAYFFLPESRPPKAAPSDPSNIQKGHPSEPSNIQKGLPSEPSNMRLRPHRIRRIFESFQRPVLGRLMGLYFINSFALAQVEAALFLFVQDRFQWSYSTASYGFAYIGIMMAFTQGFLIRKWLPKLGEARMMKIGFTVMAMGLGIMGFAISIWILAIGVTGLALGYGMSSPSLSGSISLWSQKDEQGNSLGVAQSLASLSRIAGPVCGGWLYQSIAITSPFALSSLVAVGGLLLSISLQTRTAAK